MIKYLFIVILIVCQTNTSIGQLDTEKALQLLKEEGLIVRINCHGAKLDTLKSIARSTKISKIKKEEINQQIQDIEQEYQTKTKMLMEYFDQYFDFCDVYYVPDSLFKNFIDGQRELVLLDENLDLYNPPKPISETFIFANYPYSRFRPLRLRHSKYIEQVSDYALILPPFPDKTKSTDFLRIFRSSDKREKIDLMKTVINLNEELHHLYREFH